MQAIITGDLVNSRAVDSKVWLSVLEDSLNHCAQKYDIFRGDSFQAAVDMEVSLAHVFYIKARMKTVANLDVRIGLGIGHIDYENEHIKNSTGSAFIYSGEAFDSLKKDLFAVKTEYQNWDILTNTMLSLAMELANKWTANMAETVAATMKNATHNQQELASLLHRKYQSQVSTELAKANWLKIKHAIDYCQQELLKVC